MAVYNEYDALHCFGYGQCVCPHVMMTKESIRGYMFVVMPAVMSIVE